MSRRYNVLEREPTVSQGSVNGGLMMAKFKKVEACCSICGQYKLCDPVAYTRRNKDDADPVPRQIPERWSDEDMRKAGSPGLPILYVCESCTAEKGQPPKKLWVTWAVSLVVALVGMALNFAKGPNPSPLAMVLSTAGIWVMWFAGMFLVIKSNLNLGLTFLACLGALMPWSLLYILPLRKGIDHNQRVITALRPVIREYAKNGGKTLLDKYRDGLAFLENCGELDVVKLNLFNEMAGKPFSGDDLTSFVMAASGPGGWAAVKSELKNVATEAVATLSELARQGVDLSTLQRPGGSGSPLNRN